MILRLALKHPSEIRSRNIAKIGEELSMLNPDSTIVTSRSPCRSVIHTNSKGP
jgi:hypothetical protein